jgi:myo-inositol 2-dehydrogenase/D-chiro-inositol 1-dehydrogenase
MVQMGDGRRTGLAFWHAAGRSVETVRGDQELFADAYTAELTAFVDVVRTGVSPAPTCLRRSVGTRG